MRQCQLRRKNRLPVLNRSNIYIGPPYIILHIYISCVDPFLNLKRYPSQINLQIGICMFCKFRIMECQNDHATMSWVTNDCVFTIQTCIIVCKFQNMGKCKTIG